jgi:hypothetical protein
MGLKIFGAGNTDQKSNNLLRDPQDLRDSKNVMINTSNEYVKRMGTINDTAIPYTGSADVSYIKSLGEYFYRNGSNYKSVKGGVSKNIYKWDDPTFNPSSELSIAEYLNTAIFTHIDGQNFTAKYDGQSIYRAGLPTPEVSSVTSGSNYVICFYQFIDAKGNVIYGPSVINKNADLDGTFAIQTLKDTGFYGGYVRVPLLLGEVYTIYKDQRTLVYESISDDIDVGSKITFRNSFHASGTDQATVSVNGSANNFFVQYEIESINRDPAFNEITFTAESIGESLVVLNSPLVTGVFNVQGSLSVKWFLSESETTGYYGPSSDFSYITVDNSLTSHTVNYADPIDKDFLMSSIYDITTSKLRPPKCKYLLTYGYQLACGNVISFYDFENKETKYTNNDLVMYSDLSTGDLGENFSESNRQLIGDTYDGQISGLQRVKDSLIVFKDKMAFSLDGVLIPGQYTLRKIETNEIGCTSFKSILSVANEVIFQGQDGLYAINGYNCKKVTDSLDPFFKNINPALTRSVMNNEDDQYLFWTNLGMVVYDYHFEKWFIWTGINCSSGITVDNDRSIRFFSSTLVRKFQQALNDSGVAIDAYIDTAWFDLQEPGLLKKATDIRIYSMNNAGQKLQLTYFLDWSTSKFKGPFEVNMSDSTIKTIHKNLDIIQNQSFSFRFRNNAINQDLNISGYEVAATVIQMKDKNVK